MTVNLQKLQFRGVKKIENGGELVDRFNTRSFDDRLIFMHIYQMDGDKFFLFSIGLNWIGFTQDVGAAFKWLNNAAIYTIDELHNAARYGSSTKKIMKTRKQSRNHEAPKHSTGVSYRQQKAYEWLRRP